MRNATTDKEINIFFNGGLITTEEVGENFVLCEASKLSLEEEFMKYEPRTDNEAYCLAIFMIWQISIEGLPDEITVNSILKIAL